MNFCSTFCSVWCLLYATLLIIFVGFRLEPKAIYVAGKQQECECELPDTGRLVARCYNAMWCIVKRFTCDWRTRRTIPILSSYVARNSARIVTDRGTLTNVTCKYAVRNHYCLANCQISRIQHSNPHILAISHYLTYACGLWTSDIWVHILLNAVDNVTRKSAIMLPMAPFLTLPTDLAIDARQLVIV